ncbi:hypothetical protein C427_3267 [Paraglaciecola psychrophila 170]|uniref:Uncharacterized protein n=1 Tax=Paraglaciecola psychrophila 170 TaxID=1129794 RepID=K7ARZ5_9ALTE|nr:hypothetical protein C427_3267 [Paraglaciecola psychrophila 170]GAC38050.1 hypothetical protein GPSY_2434 [Paraglaciecola psychrophila 170]
MTKTLFATAMKWPKAQQVLTHEPNIQGNFALPKTVNTKTMILRLKHQHQTRLSG